MKQVLITIALVAAAITATVLIFYSTIQTNMFSFLQRPNQYEKFWSFFLENEDALFDIENYPEAALEGLDDHLRKIHSNLSFEFGPVVNGKREFVISPSGISDAISVVEKLYDVRPPLERWDIKKFKQRKDDLADLELRFGDLALSAESIHYTLHDEGEKVGVKLYFDGYTDDAYELFGQAGFIFLDSALGEYDVMTKIGTIEYFSKSDLFAAAAKPLTNLAKEFDMRIKK